jgi:phenylacetate-CoA ligase
MIKCQMLLNYIAQLQVNRDIKKTRQELEPIVNSRLKKVFVAAYKHVPHYREIMRSAKYNPQKDFSGPEDLQIFPILTKDILKERGEREFVRRGVELSRYFSDATAGSTGKPLSVWRNPYARAVQIAKWLRVLYANGYKPTDRVFSLTSPARLQEGRSILQRFGLFRRQPVDYLLPHEKLVDAMLAYKPHVIYANRSHLDLMAAELLRRGVKCNTLKMVIAGSEVVRERNRKLYREAFQAEVVEFYGTVEMGTLAFETPMHDGLQLCEDLVYYEFLDERGNPTQPGTHSRIVVTDLTNTLMPFIRYDQGDCVVVKSFDGKDDEKWRKLSKIEGKDNDFALMPDGKRIPFHIFYEIMDKYSDIRQFRIIQKKRDLFHILIVADAAYLDSIRQDILLGCRQHLSDEILIEIKRVDKIEPDPSGKLRMLISEVN